LISAGISETDYFSRRPLPWESSGGGNRQAMAAQGLDPGAPKNRKVNAMAYLKKINDKLDKEFNGQVEAREDNGRLVLSGELGKWEDVVRAGKMAVNVKKYIGLVNDVRCTEEKPSAPRKPRLSDFALEKMTPDVLIVGGGVIGCAIARELSRYRLQVLLVDKEHDLAMQTSSRNDGMVHSGIDLRKGTLKYYYNKLGNRMYPDVCAELDVKYDRSGQYICFRRGVFKPLLYLSLIYWKWNGIKGVKVISRKKLKDREPSISSKIGAALHFPATGLVSPYGLTIAYAENAVQNGAHVSLETIVLDMETENGLIKSVGTNRGRIYPKIVVNAAGVFCEELASLAGDRFYSIHPRKGTNAILDKKFSGTVVHTAISSFETVSTRKKNTKGGGIMRTADGNTLVGPDAYETIEKEDYSTSRQSIALTVHQQGHTSPALAEHQIINYFSGIRACTYEEDFIVCKGKFTKNLVHAAGIQSPGLTAAPAIGVDAARMVVELMGGEDAVGRNPDFDPVRKGIPRLADMDDEARAELIAENPDYGLIVCRCEEISKGEIIDAMRRNIPCETIDAVKRRVRPGMGRCQGGFCGPLVLDIIAKEKGLSYSGVRKSGGASTLLFGSTKQSH